MLSQRKMTLPDSNMACLPKADYMHEDPGGAGVHLGPTGSGIGPRYRYRGDRLLLSLPVYLVPLGVWGGADGGIVLVARGPGNTAGSQHVRLYRRDYSNLGVPAYIPVIAGALVARSKITDAFLIIDPGAEPDAASASRAKETVRPPLRHAVPAALSLDTYGRDAVCPLRMGFTRPEPRIAPGRDPNPEPYFERSALLSTQIAIMSWPRLAHSPPELWDGHTAEAAIERLVSH
jgi:hypothetical protein